MDSKNPHNVEMTTFVDGQKALDKATTTPIKANGDPVTVDTESTTESVHTSVAISTDTEWRITINNSDGTKNEVIVAPVSLTNPKHQEIQIVMSTAKAKEEAEKAKKYKEPTGKEAFQNSRKMRTFVLVQQSLTALFSIVIITIMAITIIKYQSTESVKGAWPAQVWLTPTTVMLSMAVLTGIADLITVFIHCCHGKMVARLTSLVTKIRAVMGFLQAVASGSSAGFFKSAQSMSGGKDVWSWTCANADDAMAAASSAGSICNTNSAAFTLQVLQTVLHVLSLAIAVFALLRPGTKFEDNVSEASRLLAETEAAQKEYTDNIGNSGGAK